MAKTVNDSRDLNFMAAALEQAKAGQVTPGGAQVGCVFVENGRIVCSSFNEGDLQFDPTAHAEMVGIRRLCKERKTTSLKGVTILLHTTTLRHVYDGLPLGGGGPDRLWSLEK